MLAAHDMYPVTKYEIINVSEVAIILHVTAFKRALVLDPPDSPFEFHLNLVGLILINIELKINGGPS
jgi:hypothetical protein